MPVAVQCQVFQAAERSIYRGVFSLFQTVSNPRYLCALLLALFALMMSVPADAAAVKGLYQQEVKVDGQDGRQRDEAMSQALAGVLVKVSGQASVLSEPEIVRALSKPETYLREFGFRTAEDDAIRQQYFQATFDERLINQLLKKAGVSIWGKDRPSTLVWLAIENQGRRSLVASTGEFPTAFAPSFSQRGLPVLFPLMDFEDAASVSAVDVWGGFSNKILEASRRYGAQSVLTGRLAEDNDRYYGRLNLMFRGQSHSATIKALDQADVAQMAADLAGSVLSKHYAVNTSDGSSQVSLTVKDVNTLDDYATLVKYLAQVNAVRNVYVESVYGAMVSIELTIDGSESQLADALSLGRNLQPLPNTNQPLNDTNTLLYRWTR